MSRLESFHCTFQYTISLVIVFQSKTKIQKYLMIMYLLVTFGQFATLSLGLHHLWFSTFQLIMYNI